jgi:hypothetical protein
MAHKIVLVDDLDGTEIGKNSTTTRFSLDGAQYEIDLTDVNKQKLREALQPFIVSARKETRRASGAGASRPRTRRPYAGASGHTDAAAIRLWAQKNGHNVGDRGRIPAHVMHAYVEAQTI